MRILLDMDDVLTNLLDPWLDDLNNKYDGNVKRDDIYCWSMEECVIPKLHKIDGKKEIDLYGTLSDINFWDKVRPVPGAIEAVKKLNNNHEIYIATASHYNTFGPKLENCLFKYFPFLNWKQVICIYDKYLIDADILIDDNYKNIHKFVNHNKKSLGLLMDAPYNKDIKQSITTVNSIINDNIDTTHYYKREIYVNNWNEIESFINFINSYKINFL